VLLDEVEAELVVEDQECLEEELESSNSNFHKRQRV
jgi:hypothetical protein